MNREGFETHCSHNEITDAMIEASHEKVKEPDWGQLFDDDLDKDLARTRWKSIGAELRQKTQVTEFVGHQIKMLVLYHVLFEVASRHVFNEGAVKMVKNPGKKPKGKVESSNVFSYNLWFSVMKDASIMVNACERKLGIVQKEPGKNDDAKAKTAKGRQPRAADAYLSRPHRLKGATAN